MYIKTTYIAGNSIEVYKTRSGRVGKMIPRQKGRLNPTPEKMAEINERNAIDHLRRIITHNFRNGDLHLVCKYPRGKSPPPLESKKHMDRFLRDLRQLYKNWGTTLKYIHVTEYKKTSTHQHLIINDIRIPLKAISVLWEWGSVNATTLYSEPDFEKLAHYFVKETKNAFRDPDAPSKRRWNQSRSIRQPVKKVEIVGAKEWREEPRPIKGYYIDTDSVRNSVSEETGYPTQFYRMYRVTAPGTSPQKKRGEFWAGPL